ncbi:MAG: hypothetical protein P8X82_10960 [Gemmatimonadales bacterium]
MSGFLSLLPFLLAYLLIGGFYDLTVSLTAPLQDMIPRFGTLSPTGRQLTILGLLFLIFVLIGMLNDTRPARRLGGWIEREYLNRFPPYRIVRDITRQLGGEDLRSMKPALLDLGPGVRTVAFIVEELEGDRLTVYQPLTSLPTMGTLKIVDSDKVQPLDTAFMDAAGWYFNWGADTQAVLEPRQPAATKGDGP